MNVHNFLKDLSVTEIKDYCRSNIINSSVAMINIHGDFNLSTIIRNANFFGFKEVSYASPVKSWDRRGSVGTHHYTSLLYFKNETDLLNYYGERTIVAVENNIPEYKDKTIHLHHDSDCDWKDPVFIFGEEKIGLSDYVLNASDFILTIPSYGSVRSLNVGTTSGIIMNWYRNTVESQKNLKS